MLAESFYRVPVLDLARSLPGCRLIHLVAGQRLEARIVEVEAYHQDGDRAAHTYGGPNKRNRVMFGPPGHLYVYLSYGIHYCMNLVAESEGIGAGVLIRALEPLAGLELMSRFRGSAARGPDLTNGPGKCCQAMGVDHRFNGMSVCGPSLFLEADEAPQNRVILSGPRIGISKSVDLPWRFFLADHQYVSKTRPGPARKRKD